jgi:serine protease Do
MVSEVAAGAPGEQAGLKGGDVITSFNGIRVGDAQRLRWLAAVGPSGKKVPISLNRGGQAQHLMAQLAPMPEPKPSETFTGPADLGLVVHPVDVPAARAAGLAVPLGARVLSVQAGSPAAAAGLERGDVLLKIDEATLFASSMLPRALGKLRRGDQALLVVRRGTKTLFLTLRRP